MTQELYQQAMKFAGEKHSNQKVPGTNSNYLLHLSNVAMEVLIAHTMDKTFDLDFALQIAILHDTLEDTATDYQELKITFGEKIAAAVQALTKDDKFLSKKEKMMDSLQRINQLDKEVGLVKIADRITNLQTPPDHWDQQKITQYLEEARIIEAALKNKNEYLHARLNLKIMEYEKNLSRL
ncbi:MAG: bifunctional (p)ppGpp synthetase/guanosine-3',5'-bis(diphosphate) 3'-pyrophosphohydrolase [Lewinellaceae bacterium]|nr:bifunctional (p)ppGpp synthetase/guanosine-3',5'-bis(diphosphate) 3'-pyrophosphohydrolase [Lewinellaceae bacterium]